MRDGILDAIGDEGEEQQPRQVLTKDRGVRIRLAGGAW